MYISNKGSSKVMKSVPAGLSNRVAQWDQNGLCVSNTLEINKLQTLHILGKNEPSLRVSDGFIKRVDS